MRVAINTLAVIPGVTVSAETYTSSLVHSLLHEDKQNEYILILRKDNKHIFPDEGKRVSHFVAPVGVGSRVGRVLWEQLVLPWVCRSQRIDLLMIPTGVGPIWVPCRTIVVVTLMQAFQMPDSLPCLRRVYYRWFHSISLRHASRVVALSEQGRQDIQHYIGLDPAKIEVVHPGVPGEFRQMSGDARFNSIAEIGDGRDYILAVGPVQPYKNLDLLIRAFGIVRTRGIPHRLVIASGGQPVPFSLKHLADKIGTDGEVCFIERFLSREELITLYSGAAVFVHPSSVEQFNLTVLEAMACGVPVITSDLPSFREQVGDAGITVQTQNKEALQEAIIRVLSHQDLRKDMASRSLERSRMFSWIVAAQKMADIFETITLV
ncbi:MAG: group 1 glycosyl transferase [candidate division NC10 bacterium CSP1-5]|nr:MAG: group 1 glycosyl transferase [candidate division NC10 bacterium CSP1-5]